jgi:predicted nucleic acid-binding protein
MKRRVFLDANVLFSAAWREGAGLQKLWKRKDLELVSSSYAQDEAERNLASEEQRHRLAGLMKEVVLVNPLPVSALPQGAEELPEKDQPILLAALAAGAEVLVTGDQAHFGKWYGRRIGTVEVRRPAEV